MTAWLIALAALAPIQADEAPANVLRNGSFEGGLLYWHNVQPTMHRLVEGGAPAGRFALRIEDQFVMSAPFACQRGGPVTVSLFAKGDRAGRLGVQVPPSAREMGQQAGRLWTAEATQQRPLTTDWQRYRFTFPADVPAHPFWPLPHYMVLLQADVPVEVDGVVVTLADAGTAEYVPRRPLEIVCECPSLDTYAADGNLREPGASLPVRAHVSNPSAAPRDVTVRWQWFDWTGATRLAPPADVATTIPADSSITLERTMTLPAKGCVLARVSVLAGGDEIDRSEHPVTSLPYPRPPRPADVRERFGGSFFGEHSARLGSRLGFGWSRWLPRGKWHAFQPTADAFVWPDDEVALLERLGLATHLVLYGWPEWIMDADHPLPRDMRWPADDPRWDDLSATTAWDRFVVAIVEHYRGRPVIFEIANEPELDRWQDGFQAEYVRFNARTARLIKRTDPKARVMVNNVYSIPSGLNHRLLEATGGKDIDVVSWHDYRSGALADAADLRRMRASLDALGGEHLEIWFNEGWGFTNTAVDEPIACTHLTSAASTAAQLASVAEVTAAGQEKTVLFHTAYGDHGMSFWDYSGPGTMLWDWYDQPLPLVAGWNVLCHHVGLSDRVGLVQPTGARCCVFEDLRNGRGVVVAFAAGADSDNTLTLPRVPDGLVAEDTMGNVAPQTTAAVALPPLGAPIYLHAQGMSGADWLDLLAPLDRRNRSFAEGGVYELPATWDGAVGNPAAAGDLPLWRLEQVWPPDPARTGNYRPLVWQAGWWTAPADGFGGQPKVERNDAGLRMELRAAHGEPAAERIAALVFVAPEAGTYALSGAASLRFWDGGGDARLEILQRTALGAGEIAEVPLSPKSPAALPELDIPLAAGGELVLLPRFSGRYTGGDVTLTDLKVTRLPRPSR